MPVFSVLPYLAWRETQCLPLHCTALTLHSPYIAQPLHCTVPTLHIPGALQCEEYDTSECGIRYSNPEQARFCEVAHPPVWPALLPFPLPRYRDQKLSGDAGVFGQDPPGMPRNMAVVMYAGDDVAEAEKLTMSALSPSLQVRHGSADTSSFPSVPSPSLLPLAFTLPPPIRSLPYLSSHVVACPGVSPPACRPPSPPAMQRPTLEHLSDGAVPLDSSSPSPFESLQFDEPFAVRTKAASKAMASALLGTAVDSSPSLLIEPALLPGASAMSAAEGFQADEANAPMERPLYAVQVGECPASG